MTDLSLPLPDVPGEIEEWIFRHTLVACAVCGRLHRAPEDGEKCPNQEGCDKDVGGP